MVMAGRIAMRTEDAMLTLAHWFSPAFPVGSFAYSHGLEWAIDAGQITNVETLALRVEDILLHGSGRNDAVFLAAAYRTDNPAKVDELCRAFAASSERLQETDLQGAAFGQAVSDLWKIDATGLTYPVAVGFAARLCALPLRTTSEMYLHAFVSNLVSVGIRLIPIGQTAGHNVIRTLTPLCRTIARETEAGDIEGLSSTTFLADIAAMNHETQYARVFRT